MASISIRSRRRSASVTAHHVFHSRCQFGEKLLRVSAIRGKATVARMFRRAVFKLTIGGYSRSAPERRNRRFFENEPIEM